MRLLEVTDVAALPGCQLKLAFNDGSAGIADLTEDLCGPLAPLLAADLWAQAHLRHGTVTWNDDFDFAAEFLYARAHQLPPPQTLEDVVANQIRVTMRELRAIAGKSQVEVAAAMGVAQAEISRLENRADTKLSTLERYVWALGGEVDIVVRLGDRTVTLKL